MWQKGMLATTIGETPFIYEGSYSDGERSPKPADTHRNPQLGTGVYTVVSISVGKAFLDVLGPDGIIYNGHHQEFVLYSA